MRHKILAVAVALALFSGVVQAQTEIEQPKPAGRVGPKHFYSDWKWWAGEAVIAAAIAADVRSSILVLDRCPQCTEQNPLLGKRPSHKKLIGVGLAAIGIESGLHIANWHLGHDDPNRFWRGMAYWSVPVIVGSMEGYYAHHNYGLLNQSPQPQQPQQCFPGHTAGHKVCR